MSEEKLPGNQSVEALRVWSGRRLNPDRWRVIEANLGDSYLDVGCGNGIYVDQIAGRVRALGVDINEYDSWAERPGLFQTADATALPFDDDYFDTVSCFEVIEHISDPARVVRELARVARKNVIVTVPNCALPEYLRQSGLSFYHFTDRSHVNFFDLDALRKLLESAGLEVSECRLINRCNLVPMLTELSILPGRLVGWLSRLLLRKQMYMTCLAVGRVKTSSLS
ncbi:MAG: class I SAM-dependent methyltransferase [Alphaproteobacteria bacterium]|nr:MAG: class I SAM-dependent methyltransferase [Alphaproteobacteria bacterium]